MNAPDLGQVLAGALPYIDELFLGILEANLQATRSATTRRRFNVWRRSIASCATPFNARCPPV
jgi:hypothetical protein